MAACKLRIQLLCGILGVVLLSVLVASHGHSHDHHGHDHHGHAHDHGHTHGHHGHDHHDHEHHHHDHHAHEDHRHFYHGSSYSEDEGADSGEPVDLKTEPKAKSNSLNPDEYFARLKPTPGKSQEKMQMWLEAIGATVLISAAPFLILFLIPLDKDQPGQENFLRVLLAFASGGLLGDAFLHLIPHAVNPHSHGGDDHGHSHEDHGHSHGDHGHDHSQDMMVGLWVLTGIIVFLAIEKSVRHIKGEGHSHSHGHSHSKEEEKKEVKEDKKEGEVRKRKTSDKETKGEEQEDEGKSEEDKAKVDKKEEGEKKENKEVVEKEEDEIKVSAYLNLAADCTHNFTDGLAIGASFLVSRQLGIITTITILLHEVPHEIGDFAILVQSGCSKQKAMYLQLLTAVGALTGCICALLAEGAGDAATLWILPITAGGFIYIATVTVIPELLQKSSIKQSIVEIFALLCGVALMVLIAYAE